MLLTLLEFFLEEELVSSMPFYSSKKSATSLCLPILTQQSQYIFMVRSYGLAPLSYKQTFTNIAAQLNIVRIKVIYKPNLKFDF